MSSLLAPPESHCNARHENSLPSVEPLLVAPPAKGFKRFCFLVLGFLCLGLAYLGWILPGLPWSPFVVLASYCFSRSSPRMERWLLNNRFFGQYLRDLRRHHGIRRHIKLKATCMILLVVSCSVGGLIWADKPWYAWAFIPPLAFTGMMLMWFAIKTLPNDTPCSSPV